MRTPKRWTALVWIAGDNNLDQFGLKDLEEMKEVGSTDDLDIVAQFDRADDTQTRRYHLQRGTTLEADLVEEIGETNTGDPAVAIDFFSWGLENYPSEKTLGVFWNHGSGIDETEIFGRAGSRGVANRVAAGPARRALFSTTVGAALQSRAIAIDDDARDFLDNKELRSVLEQVKETANRPLDVLGFDACLMNMIELGYELRGLTGHVVGSEQTEPGDGWPYDTVLGALAANPDASPAELSTIVVEQYMDSYDGSEGVTQSAFDLGHVEGAANAVDALASALIVALADAPGQLAITKAVKNVQRFELHDFADLGDFCSLLIDGSPGDAVSEAAQGVIDALTGADGFVSAAAHQGDGVERATGASIYLPTVGDVSVVYDRLDFATDIRWNQFLTSYRAI